MAEPVLNEAGDAAVITVTPKHGPQDDRTRALVDRLRADTIPAALDGSGAEAYVGGRTARYGDEADRIASRIPLFAATVVGLSLLLLLAAFRSWRVALLSALFNLASIAAAYGVIVLAFQTQTGADLLGVEQLPVVPYVPLFMFAILFGLSTDYNVFLLSRVREEWSRHRDHRAAIAAASSGTRRIITAAGAIMVAVFLGFATDPDPVIKMTGVGLASAVLVDVTLVRLLMAPAALTLLGDRLWPGRRRPRTRRVSRSTRREYPLGSIGLGVLVGAAADGFRPWAITRKGTWPASARVPLVLVAPAAHQTGERGDAAAEHEPGHGGADQDLLAALVDLLAPVGDLGHLGAQAVDGEPELGAVGLDRAADLLRRPGGGHQRFPSVGAGDGAWRAADRADRVAGGRRRQRALDQLGLLDRHLRRRRRALLDQAHRDHARRWRRAAGSGRR